MRLRSHVAPLEPGGVCLPGRHFHLFACKLLSRASKPGRVRACVCVFFSLSFFLQKVLADIVIRAKFVSRWHTTDRCKLQTQEPLVCELPRNDRVGLPELPPCVFDKEDAAALGLVIHLWNPLSVNVSRFDWAEAFPLFRLRKKPQSQVHFTACLSLLAVDTKQKCRVPQSGFRVIPRLHSSEGGCPV